MSNLNGAKWAYINSSGASRGHWGQVYGILKARQPSESVPLPRISMKTPKFKYPGELTKKGPLSDADLDELYRDKCCYLCGRSYPETRLNIEGVLHHKESFRCLDTKGCRRAARKRRRV